MFEAKTEKNISWIEALPPHLKELIQQHYKKIANKIATFNSYHDEINHYRKIVDREIQSINNSPTVLDSFLESLINSYPDIDTTQWIENLHMYSDSQPERNMLRSTVENSLQKFVYKYGLDRPISDSPPTSLKDKPQENFSMQQNFLRQKELQAFIKKLKDKTIAISAIQQSPLLLPQEPMLEDTVLQHLSVLVPQHLEQQALREKEIASLRELMERAKKGLDEQLTITNGEIFGELTEFVEHLSSKILKDLHSELEKVSIERIKDLDEYFFFSFLGIVVEDEVADRHKNHSRTFTKLLFMSLVLTVIAGFSFSIIQSESPPIVVASTTPTEFAQVLQSTNTPTTQATLILPTSTLPATNEPIAISSTPETPNPSPTPLPRMDEKSSNNTTDIFFPPDWSLIDWLRNDSGPFPDLDTAIREKLSGDFARFASFYLRANGGNANTLPGTTVSQRDIELFKGALEVWRIAFPDNSFQNRSELAQRIFNTLDGGNDRYTEQEAQEHFMRRSS